MSYDDNYELSDYELLRLKRIRKNEERLEQLGLKSAKAKLMAETTKKTNRNQKRAKARQLVKPGEERRSHRFNKNKSGKLFMLSYAEDEDRAVTQDDYYTLPSSSSASVRKMPTFHDPGREANLPSPSFRQTKRKGLDQDFVLTQEEKDVLTKNIMDKNYLAKFQEFLVYHNKISEQNLRNVMRQVTKLANGEGIRYDSPTYGWKPHQVFMKGVKINPLSDFVELMEKAQEAEDRWGRDHGNGWLLSHPLKKMLLFQQFCLQNPDFLSSKCRLNEYYNMDATSKNEMSTVATEPETETESEEGILTVVAGDEDSKQRAAKTNEEVYTPNKKRRRIRKENLAR